METLIFTVNDWKVFEDEEKFIIRNSSHLELTNSFSKETQTWKYSFKRVPKTIDKVVRARLNILEVNSNRTFGIEIECFHRTNDSIREEAAEAIRNAGIYCESQSYNHRVSRSSWKIVTDSSINGGTGLEVVSPILSGQDGIDQIKKVMKVLSDLGCQVNRSTGLHVHVGANDLTTDQLHKVFDFYKQNEYYFDSLVSNSRRRDNNTYCRSLSGYNDFPSTRYTKVNYQAYLKYGTVEFRQHQGSLNGEKAEYWIKLVSSVVEYSLCGTVRRFNSLEEMLNSLGLEAEISWFLERAEELAS